jgi:hypothetical protein
VAAANARCDKPASRLANKQIAYADEPRFTMQAYMLAFDLLHRPGRDRFCPAERGR